MPANQQINPGQRALLVSCLSTLIFGGLGAFFTYRGHGGQGLGVTLFILLPLINGIVAAWYVPTQRATLLAAGVPIVVCFVMLFFLGWEGLVCILLVTPIALLMSLLGALLGKWLRTWRAPPQQSLKCYALVSLFLITSNYAETEWFLRQHTNDVVTEKLIAGRIEDVWANLVRIDHLGAPKPFLMRIGLPIPLSCSLEGDGVGATRTCHFQAGDMVQRIEQWTPPNHFSISIQNVTLPGRKWLGFLGAQYTLQQIDGQILVTRTTTVSSWLRPIWYWSIFEKLALDMEHEYLLESLKRNVEAES